MRNSPTSVVDISRSGESLTLVSTRLTNSESRAMLIGDWDHNHSPPLRVNESRAQLTRPGYHTSRTKGLERQLDQAAVRSGPGGPVNDEAKAAKPQRRSHLGPSSSAPIS